MDILDEVTEELASMDSVVFAYLFGSYSTDEQTDESDVDIALYLQDTSFDTQLDINYKLSKRLNKNVDIVILNRVKNIFLLENILKDGIILKDSQERFDFELNKQHQILDFKAFKRYINAA